MKTTESQQQIALFQWVGISFRKYPQLKLLYHIPNGGKRDVRVAAKLKREGTKPGVLDIHLPVARQGFHSLYIEMKVGSNKLTKLQQDFKRMAESEGNLCVVCYSWVEAKDALEGYLRKEI